MSKFIELTHKSGKVVVISTKSIISFYSVLLKIDKDSEEKKHYTEIKTTSEAMRNCYENTFIALETTEEIKEKINSINKIA